MRSLLIPLLLTASVPSSAQHAHQPEPQAAAEQIQPSPYAGMQQRRIKALSEQQVADLRAGKGMSYALAAELNGYPGPLHVLELAQPLNLTAQQLHQTRKIYDEMKAQTGKLGAALIDSEERLDSLFRNRQAIAVAVQRTVREAAKVQAELRAAHLHYHLRMAEVLTPSQLASYNRLRGYQ